MDFKQKGQISIFFSTTVIVMITFMAFIINIGMLVKAKINLQNATDAAAYAGASVQARQLTNIAYLNWEMRNIYKEWMFKYYVLGSLNLEGINNSSGDTTDFRMASYLRSANPAVDRYNFPSTCVDFSNTGGVGLCTKYVVPGLPRFSSSNVLGMDETTNAFVDGIVAEKSRDCSERTKLNFLTANLWAYNVKIDDPALSNLNDQAPEIGVDRMGAFPQAFELALRIRNLELQVNHPPINGICMDTSLGVNCNRSVQSLNTPSTERSLKALLTGWRNIGASDDNQMKNSFTIKELSPREDTSFKTFKNLSTALIPLDSQGVSKFYLDLKLMTVNYAPFYTAFTSNSVGRDSDAAINVSGVSGGIAAEGQCAATKMGLPVPGYPFGFVKSPDILTYYAIETKTNFTGLFNPFQRSMVLSAYAAAKPFGGRIGPQIFDVSNRNELKARRSARISSAYISGLDITNPVGAFQGSNTTGLYKPGMPVPLNSNTANGRFWMNSPDDVIGGIVESEKIVFGIPNLFYEYPNKDLNAAQDALETQAIQLIELDAGGVTVQPTKRGGFYNADAFSLFKSKLRGIGSDVTPQNIGDALNAVRAPTIYDANNYLIPTPEDINSALETDSWGSITGEQRSRFSVGGENYRLYDLTLYAPMFSSDPTIALYKSPNDLVNVLDEYLISQKAALEKYQAAMNIVASDIFINNRSSSTGANTGVEAAKEISDLPITATGGSSSAYEAIAADESIAKNFIPTCASIAGKFLHFYLGANSGVLDAANCPTSLPELMRSRWSNNTLTNDLYQEFSYVYPESLSTELFTAYRPGPQHGAGQDGVLKILIGAKKEDTMIRNFYSTKFIPLKSLTQSQDSAYGLPKLPIYSEGATGRSEGAETVRSNFANFIEDSEISIPIENLNH